MPGHHHWTELVLNPYMKWQLNYTQLFCDAPDSANSGWVQALGVDTHLIFERQSGAESLERAKCECHSWHITHHLIASFPIP